VLSLKERGVSGFSYKVGLSTSYGRWNCGAGREETGSGERERRVSKGEAVDGSGFLLTGGFTEAAAVDDTVKELPRDLPGSGSDEVFGLSGSWLGSLGVGRSDEA